MRQDDAVAHGLRDLAKGVEASNAAARAAAARAAEAADKAGAVATNAAADGKKATDSACATTARGAAKAAKTARASATQVLQRDVAAVLDLGCLHLVLLGVLARPPARAAVAPSDRFRLARRRPSR